jgi:hypothetical protein
VVGPSPGHFASMAGVSPGIRPAVLWLLGERDGEIGARPALEARGRRLYPLETTV